MNILFFVRGYPTNCDPIRGIFEFQQALALQQAGHNVIFACLILIPKGENGGGKIFSPVGVSKKQIQGLTIYEGYYLPAPLVLVLKSKLYRKLIEFASRRLYRHVVKDVGKPDVIYSHYLWMNYFNACLGKKFHIPTVGVEHWSELNRPEMNPCVRAMGMETYLKLTKLICVSQALADRINSVFGVEGRVVNNIIDIDYNLGGKKEKTDKKVKIVSVGRLTSQKKIDDMIKALAKVDFDKDCWELTIVGSGPLEEELKNLTQQVGLDNNIHFVGLKSHEEVCQIYSKSDFFCLASDYETFGVVFVEAMSFGLPVIGTRCGGPEYIINKSNGLLVERGDIDGLTEAIKTMMNTYKHYSAESIRAEAKARYSPEAIVPQITNVLADAISENDKYPL